MLLSRSVHIWRRPMAVGWPMVILLGCGSSPPPTPQAAAPAPAPAVVAPAAPAAPAAPTPAATPSTPWPTTPLSLLAFADSDRWRPVEVSYGGTTRLFNFYEDVDIGGVGCSSYLWVGDERWACGLARPTAVPGLGVTVKAGADMAFNYATSTPYFVDVTTLEPAVTSLNVEGVPCAGVVRLDREGHLLGCTLAGAHSFGSWSVGPGTEVTLSGGTLVRARGAAPITRGDSSVDIVETTLFDPTSGEVRGVEARSSAEAWPADEGALAALVPLDAFGVILPLVGDLEGYYGDQWKLTRAVDLAGVLCQGSVSVSYDTWTCTLARPYAVADPPVVIRAGVQQGFYLGAPRPTALDLNNLEPAPATMERDGVSCKGTLTLHSDGHLTSCTLAAPHTFGAWTLPEGTGVVLEAGRLSRCDLTQPFDFGGLPCTTQAVFAEDGKVSSCELGAAHTFGKWTLPQGTIVSFQGERLASAEVYTAFKLGDRAVEADHTIYFGKDPDEISSVQETAYGD